MNNRKCCRDEIERSLAMRLPEVRTCISERQSIDRNHEVRALLKEESECKYPGEDNCECRDMQVVFEA